MDISLLFRLIWPVVGRDRIFTLRTTPTADGYAVQSTDDAIVASTLRAEERVAPIRGG